MDSITHILRQQKPAEPPQIEALRAYVATHYGTTASVSVSSRAYNLTVPNGMIASSLQMEIPKIIEACALDKRLFIRIGRTQ